MVRTGYSTVGTIPISSLGMVDGLVANAFYINKTLGEIMGNEAHIIACNATVGSPVDGRDSPINRSRVIISSQTNITIVTPPVNTSTNGQKVISPLTMAQLL